MNRLSRDLTLVCLLFVACLFVLIGKNALHENVRVTQVRSQVQRIVDELDKKTTESGVYIRADDDLREDDPWGRRIRVSYSQGGVAEMVEARSAGPDGQFHTDDDVTAQAMSANLQGIGTGIRENIEKTSTKAAKGAVKGAIEGLKDSIKEALPKKAAA